MDCPRCSAKTGVYSGNLMFNGEYLRRRKCPECGHRFITLERITSLEIQGDGKKRGGKRVPWGKSDWSGHKFPNERQKL